MLQPVTIAIKTSLHYHGWTGVAGCKTHKNCFSHFRRHHCHGSTRGRLEKHTQIAPATSTAIQTSPHCHGLAVDPLESTHKLFQPLHGHQDKPARPLASGWSHWKLQRQIVSATSTAFKSSLHCHLLAGAAAGKTDTNYPRYFHCRQAKPALAWLNLGIYWNQSVGESHMR